LKNELDQLAQKYDDQDAGGTTDPCAGQPEGTECAREVTFICPNGEPGSITISTCMNGQCVPTAIADNFCFVHGV
jgi:hypothetical protein